MNVQRPNESAAGDQLGCAESLRRALSRAELSAFDDESTRIVSENEQAALWLAVALGRCRLFGVDPGDLNGVLPQRTAIAAAAECSRQLRHWTENFGAFARRCDNGDVDSDCDLEAGHFLFIRMDIWAAVIAIDEAYEASLLDKGASTGRFRRVIGQLAVDSRTFDTVMQDNMEVICMAANTELLKNWRDLLAPPYRNALPWWLDRTLEAVADQIEENAIATQPSDAAWRKLVNSRFDLQSALDTSGKTTEAGRPDAREMPVVRSLQETLEDLAEAIRRLFRPEARLANAAASDEKKEVKVLLDSQEDLGPIRGILYQMPNGDLRLALSSSDETVANQTYEVIIQEQTRPTVTFRKSSSGRWFGQVKIPHDQLPEVGLFNLSFRLKKL